MGDAAPDQPEDSNTVAPLLIALGIVVFVLIAMTGFRMIGGDRTTDESLVGRAVVAQNDALQREDYSAFRGYTCVAQQGAQADVIAGQQRSKTDRGARFVDDVTDIKIDGDRAAATVVYHFERTPDDKVTSPTAFVREDSGWKVCSAGPR
ncbi:MAG: Rv0361 family membrane protein [Mycobacterium sp.]